LSGAEPAGEAHEPFIDDLIERNAVLMGGGFGAPVAGVFGAYVLATETYDEAARLAVSDPLVREADVACQVIEWRLVAINPGAIDPDQVVGSRH
jgi:hypothetical protein